MAKYTSVSISGYNATPPSDDGTVSEANKVKWSTEKTKLTDPLKTAIESINTNIVSALDVGPTALVTNTTLGTSHYGDFIQVSGAGVTLTLTDAATLGSGWYCEVINTDSTNTVTIGRATGADTINGTAANISLLPYQAISVFVNAAANGFIATVKRTHSTRFDFSDGSLSGGLPFEGTTADGFETTLTVVDPTADQTATLPDATGTVSLSDPIVASAKALKITNNATNPNYQIDITADSIVLENASSVSLKLATWSVTVDITASGANGLDTGAEANSTWYYIWAIYDGTNKRGLISASATAPTLPSGYTYKALIGAWYNDSGGNLVGGVQLGKEFYYKAGQVVLNAGTATTETSVSLTAYVPPVTVSEVAFLHTDQVGSDAGAGVTSTLTLRFITAVDYMTNLHNSTAGGGSSSLTNFVAMPLVATSYYYLLQNNTAGSAWSTTHRLLGFRIK